MIFEGTQIHSLCTPYSIYFRMIVNPDIRQSSSGLSLSWPPEFAARQGRELTQLLLQAPLRVFGGARVGKHRVVTKVATYSLMWLVLQITPVFRNTLLGVLEVHGWYKQGRKCFEEVHKLQVIIQLLPSFTVPSFTLCRPYVLTICSREAQINPHVQNKRGATPLDLCSDVSTREAPLCASQQLPRVTACVL